MNTLPAHLFLSCSGELYDTRRPDWASHPLRPVYARTMRSIRAGADLRATLRAGPRAWPGGYPIVLITSDGEMVSPAALLKDRSALYQALYDIRHKMHGRIVGADVYWEGPPIQCAYTGAEIVSAYGETEETEEGADNGN